METLERAALAAQFADSKKADDIRVLDVTGLCNFTDCLVICSANNRLQINAISDTVCKGFKDRGFKSPKEEGHRNGSWTVLDLGDVVVHLMTAEAREFYRLEKLWGDAKEIDWHQVSAGMKESVAL